MISNFLKKNSSLSTTLFSSISRDCLFKKALLFLLVIPWNSAFRWVYLSISHSPIANYLEFPLTNDWATELNWTEWLLFLCFSKIINEAAHSAYRSPLEICFVNGCSFLNCFWWPTLGRFWRWGVISGAPALVCIQSPEAVVFKVLLQDVSTRRQHVPVSRSGWAASRALREESGFPGWERRVDRGRRNSRGLVLLAVSRDVSHPRRMPSPDRLLRWGRCGS